MSRASSCHFLRFVVVAVIGVMPTARRASGSEPATQPATLPTTRPAQLIAKQINRPTAVQSEKAKARQFMLDYDSLAGAEPDAYQSLYQVTPGTDDLKLAQVQSRFDAQVGMLQKIVALRFGDAAEGQAIHAFGFQTIDDIQTCNVVFTGDRAVVTYFDGTPGPQLVRVFNKWQLDTTAFRDSLGMSVDAYTARLHQIALIVADIADAIDHQQFATIDAVAHEIASRTTELYR